MFHKILDTENLLWVEDTGIFRGVQTNYFHISFPFLGVTGSPRFAIPLFSVFKLLHIWKEPLSQAFSSLTVWASTSFPSVPTMPTLSPTSSPAPHLLPVNSLLTSHLITLHSRLQKSSGPNAFTLRSLPVPSHLNIHAWHQRRFDYPDKFVCGFLEFSWPVSHTHRFCPISPPRIMVLHYYFSPLSAPLAEHAVLLFPILSQWTWQSLLTDLCYPPYSYTPLHHNTINQLHVTMWPPSW